MLCLASFSAWAADRGVYKAPSTFVEEAFSDGPPEIRKLWVTGDLKERVAAVLGHDLGQLRVRYWAHGMRTAWILEEIGKEALITAGFVIDSGRLLRVEILVYRESRGWEVRYPFFTNQFRDARLRADDELDRNIDGISGATLSVRAIERLARVALLLDHRADHGDPEPQPEAP